MGIIETVQPISQPAEIDTTPRKRRSKKGLFIALLALIVIGGAAYAYTRTQSANNTSVSPTPEFVEPTAEPEPTESLDESPTPEEAIDTPTPTSKVTPTPKPAATKSSELNIQVLNGSGAEGVASSAKTFLTDKKYDFIETGNADNFDYEGVTVKSKESVADYVKDLSTDLKEKYTITSDSATLSEDSLFDVVVIVGK